MSAQIKRYGIFIGGHGCPYLRQVDGGAAVLYADHLASHAYDEAKERAAFEAAWSSGAFPLACVEDYALCLCVWLAAAKSRAKAAGCL